MKTQSSFHTRLWPASTIGLCAVALFVVGAPEASAGFTPQPSAQSGVMPVQSQLTTLVPHSAADLVQHMDQRSRRGGGGGGGGQAVPRGGSSGGSGRSGGSSGGSTPSGGSSGGGARARSGGDSNATGGSTSGGATATSRPRDGRPATGTAVEREGDAQGGGRPIIIDRGYPYYPWGWGWGGLGIGAYGYYDPWNWGWYDPYGPGGYGYGAGYDGSLKLKVKPRQAEVFVDGYFAGAVDDYDGAFQRLRLDAGPHRIEVRLDGYETLEFDVRILPGRTVTYKGEMSRTSPED